MKRKLILIFHCCSLQRAFFFFFFALNGIKLWDMLKIFCHKICPTPWRTGSHKTPLWLSYAIVCPHMQNNNGSRPARHPPFTWVSYSAIISLSFLTFAWDDMLWWRGEGGGIELLQSSARSFGRRNAAVARFLCSSLRVVEQRSDAYQWHQITRIWNSWEVGAQRRRP